MADQPLHRLRRSIKRSGGAFSFVGIRNLASIICLLSICSGCHLGGKKSSEIRFSRSDTSFSNSQYLDSLTARASSNQLSNSQTSPMAQNRSKQSKNGSPKQNQGTSGIGLVSFVQDEQSLSLEEELAKPNAEGEVLELDEVDEDGQIVEDDQDEEGDEGEASSAESEDIAELPIEPLANATLPVDAVLQSTLYFYPEIQVVIEELAIANGGQISAAGSFDTKVKVENESTPVGFYETYRSKFGIEQPTFNGGSVFAGYRFGRGDFSTWYLERNTNALGEINVGANWKLLRDRQIDARRVALWKSQIKRNAVEPVVHQQLLQVFRDAEVAFWNWVAAGQVYQRNSQLLQVARNRVAGIEERIKAGDLADITRTDNDRTILSREVKLIKAKAKLDQAAIKLSLYYRDNNGTPIIANESQLPEFESQVLQVPSNLDGLVSDAITCRPETRLLALDLQSIGLDLAKAKNDLLPQLNASVKLSNDFGRPTSASAAASSSTQTVFVFFDEKDEFQVDTGIFLSQSLQLRKTRGKIQSLQGKQRQLEIKRQFVEQKIVAEVQQNYQLTVAAREQVRAATQNYALAQKLSAAARDRIKVGDADLFEIILREQQELDAAIELVASQFAFFSNRAGLNASVGCEQYQSYERFLLGR